MQKNCLVGNCKDIEESIGNVNVKFNYFNGNKKNYIEAEVENIGRVFGTPCIWRSLKQKLTNMTTTWVLYR